ncbi:YfcE family phosphodiesterase [Ruminococcaceae bacterium OttesenSCG-928-A16]|nr:YfcE family phosphodiesterase [Ruminococcaceae bacterium OttesenSCG-928-A16]
MLVFSDTHGSSVRMINVVAQHPDVAAILFLGDGERDADALAETYPKIPLYRVSGNCDFASQYPPEGLAPFGGLLLFYTHGHAYNVKLSLGPLLQAAKRSGAHAALYGHTHAAAYQVCDKIHLFNPGSLNLPRGGSPSYGLISVQKGQPNFAILPYTK